MVKYLASFFFFLAFPAVVVASSVGINADWSSFDAEDSSEGTTILESSSSSTSSPSGSSATSDSAVADEAIGSAAVRTCRENQYEKPFIALNFLKKVANPNQIRFEDISINEHGELEGTFSLGAYISACFEPTMVAERVGNKVFIRMANAYFEKYKDEFSDEDGVLEAPNVDLKYKRCLEKEGLLDEGGQLDMAKVRSDHLINSEASFRFVDGEGRPLTGFDKDLSYDLHFASNRASSYASGGERTLGTPQNWQCTSYNPLSDGDRPFIRGPAAALFMRANELCDERNPARMIKDILKLRDSSVGNAKELASVLDHIFINRLKDRQAGLFEDGDGDIERGLEKLERKMRKLLRNSRKNKADIDEANQVAKEYKQLLGKLEGEVFGPATALIERLHKEYGSASDEEKDVIKEKLRKLSQIMGRLAKKRKKYSCSKIPCSFYKRFYIHEGEGGFDNDAMMFERLRLASGLWSQAKKSGRGKKLTPKKIKGKIAKGVDKFENIVSGDSYSWDNEAALLEGDISPLRDAQRRVRSRAERMRTIQEDYYKKQRKELGFWCSMANTGHCRKKKDKRDRRYRQMMGLLGKKMGRDQGLIQHYGGLWGQYLESEQEEGEDGYFDDEYSSGYEEDFPGWNQDPYAPGHFHYNNINPGGTPPPYGPSPYNPNNYHLHHQGPPVPQSPSPYNPYVPPGNF